MSAFNKIKNSIRVDFLFAVLAVLLIAVLLLVNVIAMLLSERYPLQVDLTSDRAYQLSDETREFLASLAVPIEIFVLSDEGGFSDSKYLDQAKRIIDQYPLFSSNISLSYIDYLSNPAFSATYPQFSLSHGDIVVRSFDSVAHVPAMNLFNYSRAQDGSVSVVASRAEEALLSAIYKVISDDIVRVAALTGNGSMESPHFNSMLTDSNYELTSASLLGTRFDDYDVLMLFSPVIDLPEDIIRALEEFLYNDGRYGKILLYTAGAAQGAMPNLDRFLSQWGVSFSNGAVFETNPELTYQFQPFYPLAQYTDTSFTDRLRDSTMPFLMPLSRPMELLFTSKDGYYVETLLVFSEASGARPADAGDDFRAEDALIRGPLPALVTSSFNAYSAEGELMQSHVIVSSSTGIFDPAALQNTALTNGEYLLTLIEDLTGREDVVSVQPKFLQGRALGITSSGASTLGVILVGILPGAILITGIVIWLLRRFK